MTCITITSTTSAVQSATVQSATPLPSCIIDSDLEELMAGVLWFIAITYIVVGVAYHVYGWWDCRELAAAMAVRGPSERPSPWSQTKSKSPTATRSGGLTPVGEGESESQGIGSASTGSNLEGDNRWEAEEEDETERLWIHRASTESDVEDGTRDDTTMVGRRC
ncbi:hypothetical protein FA95DRAFT_1605259 [Auriscalpium vulgare]|uniref:Uncharacterized protein n=1 Tax=Auriscalpium vulgare TaxID=40419 RepID=A0ACB8RW36_9AGAM|nr:hypothetical protein FA95DRAFT_1605259 [Auriscalpium vulgare]